MQTDFGFEEYPNAKRAEPDENFIVELGDMSGKNQPGIGRRSAIPNGIDVSIQDDRDAGLRSPIPEPDAGVFRFEQKEVGIQLGTINIFEDLKFENGSVE